MRPLDLFNKAINFAEYLKWHNWSKLIEMHFFAFGNKMIYQSVRTSMDRLLMKCACGCLENVSFFSKTVQLIPVIKQKETYTKNNTEHEWKHGSNLMIQEEKLNLGNIITHIVNKSNMSCTTKRSNKNFS